MKEIYKNVTVGGSEVSLLSLEFNEGYKTPISKLQFTTNDASIDWLGESVVATIGLDGDNNTIFNGYVDDVVYTRLPGVYEITCSNDLKLAQNFLLVTDSLESPWTRNNIAAEDLVGALLSEADLTDYSGDTSSFTFGVNSDVEFNLIIIMDAINQINSILAYTLFMDGSTVRWSQVFPEPADVATSSINEFIQVSRTWSTQDLRNKVIVFGADGIRAEASEESPYLPDGFYQTAVVSSELIDSQSMADQSVVYNLRKYNKLTEELRIDIEGNSGVNVRDTIHVTMPLPGAVAEKWFVYAVRHTVENTFTTSLHLRK